jgi:hypothetical protein
MTRPAKIANEASMLSLSRVPMGGDGPKADSGKDAGILETGGESGARAASRETALPRAITSPLEDLSPDNGASALAGPHNELAYQKRLAEDPPTPKGQVTTCSYNCRDSSEAIALRKEDWINGCWSGKQISRMLRNLH